MLLMLLMLLCFLIVLDTVLLSSFFEEILQFIFSPYLRKLGIVLRLLFFLIVLDCLEPENFQDKIKAKCQLGGLGVLNSC